MRRGILIDPFEKSITAVEVGDAYTDIYPIIKADTFTIVHITPIDTVFIDDEGLFVEDQRFFQVFSYHQPLAGRGLILGTDYDTGDSISTELTIEEVEAIVTWPDVTLDRIETVQGIGTLFGAPVPVIGSRPVFKERDAKEE